MDHQQHPEETTGQDTTEPSPLPLGTKGAVIHARRDYSPSARPKTWYMNLPAVTAATPTSEKREGQLDSATTSIGGTALTEKRTLP